MVPPSATRLSLLFRRKKGFRESKKAGMATYFVLRPAVSRQIGRNLSGYFLHFQVAFLSVIS
jgi:hypothetical protein